MSNKSKRIRKNKSILRRRKFSKLHYKDKLVSKRRKRIRSKRGGSRGDFGVMSSNKSSIPPTNIPPTNIPSDKTKVLTGELNNLVLKEVDVLKELNKAITMKEEYPNNITLNSLDTTIINEDIIKNNLQDRLLKCIWTGIQNPDSAMGSYAMNENDYDDLGKFFDTALKQYHQPNEATFTKHYDSITSKNPLVSETPEVKRDNGLSLGSKPFIFDDKYFVSGPPSVRVRVGRNIKNQPLPASLTLEQRINIENTWREKLKDINEGVYKSLSTHSDSKIDEHEKINYTNKVKEYLTDDGKIPVEIQKEYSDLVKKAEMFKSMSDDKYLAYAGIANHWPEGKGSYTINASPSANASQSDNIKQVIWIGEEDHLRIFAMGETFNIGNIFSKLTDIHKILAGENGENFSWSKNHGYITSCPTNLGTGMRASVRTSFLNICKPKEKNIESTVLYQLLKNKTKSWPFKMSIRGGGGEHTPIGIDGAVDISPSKRYGLTEKDIIEQLWFGVNELGRINNEVNETEKITATFIMTQIENVNNNWRKYKSPNTSEKDKPKKKEISPNVDTNTYPNMMNENPNQNANESEDEDEGEYEDEDEDEDEGVNNSNLDDDDDDDDE